MRTTVTLEKDTLAAITDLRRRRSIGLSQAINELIRAGLAVRTDAPEFRQRSRPMGARLDLTNVAEVLEVIDGPAHR